MARSRARAASPPRSTSRSKKADTVEVVEEDSGLGIEDGIAIITSLILVAAILMVDYQLGTTYGKGIFF